MATKVRKGPDNQSRELFIGLQQPQKIAIRQKTLECLQNETQNTVRHKIGDAVAEIARQYAESGKPLVVWRAQYVSLKFVLTDLFDFQR